MQSADRRRSSSSFFFLLLPVCLAPLVDPTVKIFLIALHLVLPFSFFSRYAFSASYRTSHVTGRAGVPYVT